jgi:hypothetical protein
MGDQRVYSRYDVPDFFNMVSVPLTTIHRIYSAAPRNSIYIVCKDFRVIRITLAGFENSKSKVDTFLQIIHNMVFLGATSGEAAAEARFPLFAFRFSPKLAHSDKGWNLCDMIKEYVRQGIYDSSEWQVNTVEPTSKIISAVESDIS